MPTSLCRLEYSPVRTLFRRSLATLLLLLAGSAVGHAQSGIKLVQHKSLDGGTTTTASLAFASPTTAGNWIGVAIRAGLSSSQVFTIADSSGNTYKKAAQIGFTSTAVTVAIYYAENIKGGANTVTVSDTVSGPLRVAILEYSGVAASNSLDATATATGSSTSPNSGNLNTTASGDLLLGSVASTNSQAFTAGAGYTAEDFVPAEPNTKLITEDQVQAAAGAASASATLSSSDAWGAVLAAFKSASGVAGPNITSLNPTAGAVGTSVTIAGANFGSTQGSSTVAFNGTAATPTSWSTASIVVPVPTGATTGNVVVTVGGAASNGVAFTVTSAPIITSVTPSSGLVGTSVTIAGANFGSSQGSTTVTFNGTAATPTSWSATSIVAPVPSGATTGNVIVTVGGVASNGVAFTVTVATNIKLAQTASLDAGTTTTASLAFTSSNTAGNWIGVAIRAGNSSSQVFTVTDSNGNSYQQGAQLGLTANSLTVAIYYAENIKGGVNTVTVSDTVSGPLRIAILEYSGIAISSSLDATAMGQGTSTAPNSGNLTTAASGDLLLAAIATINSGSFTAGSGYTIEDFVPAEPSTKLITEDQIQAASGTVSAGTTLGTSDNWGAVLVAVKAPGGAAGSPSSIAATAGTPQSATINTAFGLQLQATVKDSFNSPVGGVTVTFTAPSSGASGTFAGGVNTATSNTQGVATAAVFTANSVAGGYSVTASVAGVASPASFSLTNLAGAASSITATAGTPQSATVNAAFATQLQATVKDSFNNPVGGATVTFTAPGSGASGTFAGGVNTATTNAQGIATAAVFTADSTAGGPYTVTATVTGVGTPANFSLTNLAGAASTITATAGTPQNATINTAFTTQLQATVKDSFSNPVSGVTVTFAAPGSGASGTFAGGVKTAITNAQGVATAAVFTANSVAGGYSVTASVTGVATAANFSLTNLAGAASAITATAGTPQSATVNTAFAIQLQATVTDSGNNPVSGVTVTFTAPTSGASGTFAGGVNTATTNAQGVATAPVFTANSTAGGPYNVTASATGVGTTANFSLTNLGNPPASITATAGTSQSATISTAFATQLQATVTDSGNNPVSGVTVTFAAPGSGPSGTFAGGVKTAITNAQGVATAAVFTANSTAGAYNVTASVSGVATPANFSLTNLTGAASVITATAGTPQSATVNTAFAVQLQATVTDSGNNPVSGVTVTFTAPGSGPSGTFAGGVNTATSNTQGVATAAVFTANSVAGGYSVTASVAGVASPASFSLTNLAGAASSITATAGTPQSATVNAAFATQLQATVKDSFNNPVGGATVTFTAPGSGASGTFAGGVNTATTNAQGIATAAVFTANSTAGGPYTVTATVTGVGTPANFSLTNTASVAVSIALVQHTSIDAGTTTTGSLAFKSSNTAGNWIGVAIRAGLSSSQVFTVKDSNGNTYKKAAQVGFTSSAVTLAVYYAENIKGGANTVTVSDTVSGPFRFAILEYSGVATSNSLDATATATATSTSPNSGSVNTTANGDLLLGAIASTNSQAFTGGSGYTAEDFVPAEPNTKLITEDQIQAAAGAASAGATLSSSDAWGAALASFKAASAGSAGPTITSLSQNTGAVGVIITITGTNFGASQGTSTVTFNGTTATVQNWNATTIMVPVPAGATTGPVVVTVGGVPSNGVNFTVIPPPSISSISPTSGPLGTSVTITGTNFGASQGTSTVTFNAVAGAPTSWSATSIVVPVPNGATTGNVVVTVAGTPSNGVPFTVTAPGPSISSLSLTQGPVGATFTVNGANFGTTQGSSTVTLNGALAAVSNWTASSINVTVPAGATTGNVIVTVNGTASNGLNFTVTPPPAISTINPTSGPVGTNVTITGTNFGPTVGMIQSFVTFNGVQTRASNWSNTSITAPVPTGATTGNVLVNVGGVPSNGVLFTVAVAPSITNLSPTSGTVGTSVTISGANFGTSQGTSSVTFNGTAATPTSWSTSSILVPVPSGAKTGNVVVTVSGIASNGVNFTVTSTSNNISLVQHRSLDAGTSTSGSLAFTSNNAAGNWIAVAIRAGLSGSQVFTVTDSNGNTYQRAFQIGVNGNALTLALYYAENIKGGANTITVSDTVSGPLRFSILEYSGVATSNSLDATPVAAQGSSATPNSGNLTTAAGGDLLLGTVATVNAASFTAGSGYTIEEFVPAEPNTKLVTEDQLQLTAGTASANATLAASDNWGAGLAAFRSINGTALPIAVTVSPTSASAPSGYGTQAFTATVSNDFQNRGATWSLSGVGCSGSTCGTLSNVTTTSVTYTAPPNIPSPATVTLTATAIGDNTKAASATITVTQGVLTILVSPKRAAVTMSALHTVQFTSTVYNDPSNAGVTWQVDGNNGGNSTTGTVSSTGLYVPGSQTGQHSVTAVSNANANISASAMIAVTDLAGVYTHHNDNARTGQNLKEYGLTPATVSSTTFGQLFSCPVDSYVYAQPLWVANLTFGATTRNVVFIATEHDSVYAFDADSPACVQLWQVNFLGTGVTTMTPSDLNGNTDIVPEIGITSTPVIDATTNTLYVMPKTKETVGTVNGQACSSSSPCYVHRLHALDLITGAEKFGGPVVITAPNFVPQKHLQRPALLLANNTVYIAFGSHGDQCNYQSWVMGYNASTLAQVFATPTTNPTQGCTAGGIWLAGAGPAADANGNVYVSTGNGTYDGVTNWADTAVKLSPTGSILDWFTPFNQSVFQANDIDLASSGVVILPDTVASAAHPHLALATGKVAILYLLDQNNMGRFNSSTNHDVQEVIPVPPPNTTLLDGGNYGDVAYWNGNIYTTGQNFPLSQFQISNGAISTPQSATSTNSFPPRGGTPVVSANGTTGGITWIIDYTGWQSSGNSILDAYDATNVGTLLYSSPSTGAGAAGPAVKFIVPTVANGRVYVGNQFSFSVFGLLP